jgi:hypothetical protein
MSLEENTETKKDEKKSKKDTQKQSEQPEIKEVGGVRGWLLRKAKTFMWDAKSNTLVLPKGVVLTLEEKAELEAIFGKIVDHASEVVRHREEIMMKQQQVGVKFKADVIKGYSLLVNGSYRELTGVVAHKIHENLKNVLMINNRFMSSLWKSLSSANKNEQGNIISRIGGSKVR